MIVGICHHHRENLDDHREMGVGGGAMRMNVERVGEPPKLY